MKENSDQKLSWDEFMRVEMRVGTILEAQVLEKVRDPAYKIRIDFGEFGIRKTSAQLTKLYSPENIIGKQVIAVINFPVKQIGTYMSECLILGAIGSEKAVILIEPERKVKNGLRIG